MAGKVKTIRHIQVPTRLDWEKFWDKQYRESPRRAEEMARVATHAKIQAESFAERDYPRSRRMRDEREEIQKRMQQKAEFNASQMELRYSQKQKREMDRLLMVPQLAEQSGIFTEDQLDKINQETMLRYLGYTPTEQFKLTQFPKGQGFGENWLEDDGTRLGRDDKGNPKLLLRFDQSREAQSMKEEQDSIKTQAILQAKIDGEKRSFERDLYNKDVISADGLTRRSRTPEEVRQILRGYGRSNEINKARDLISEVNSKYNSIDEIPEGLRQQFFDAHDLIEDIEAKKDMPTVINDADYKKLPSGAEFIDSEGNKWRKP